MENEKEWIVTVDGFGHTTITAGEVSIAIRGGRDIAEHLRIVSLISAAPLLLAACKTALEYLEYDETGDDLGTWAITMSTLRTATTAAEGRDALSSRRRKKPQV